MCVRCEASIQKKEFMQSILQKPSWGTRRNNNVIITPKRRRDVVLA